MELSKKVKTALDESRILILGGQILLGFECRGAFAQGFERLPAHAQTLMGVALGLMVIVIGLLIMPNPYHRIVEHGADSGTLHALVTDITDLSLLPFGLAIGIDVFIAAERIFATVAAVAAGIAVGIVALGLWYGLPRVRRRYVGERERKMTEQQRGERQEPPLHARIEQTLTEARVILPGAQALFGFQLSIVLTTAFEKLPDLWRIVHAVSVGLVALSVMLLMAPAAYHRIVYQGEDTEDVQRTAGWMITGATVPLAFGLSADIYVVIAKIAGPIPGMAAAGAGLVMLLGLWYGFPIAAALHRGASPRMTGSTKSQPQSG